MTVQTRQAKSMSNELNGNGGGSESGAGTSVNGGAIHANSSSRMSFEQKPNMNTSMGNMNMLETGNQFNQLESEGDFIVFNSEDGVEDSNSNSDNSEDISDDDQAEIVHNTPSGPKRKRYHRHTSEQIQAMETFFKECPHPDDKQRKQIGSALGLEPLQVKFWFQNKRTQVKAQQERHENQQLRNENDRLIIERMNLHEAIRNNMTCRTCGGQKVVDELVVEEITLWNENQRLRQEINRMSEIALRLVGRPFLSFPNGVPMLVPRPVDPGQVNMSEHPVVEEVQEAADVFRALSISSEVEKTFAIELAVMAMNEVVALAKIDPLNVWVPSIDGSTMMLNHQEYFAIFTPSIGLPPPGFKFEASRATAVVKINHAALVGLFMNVKKWSTIFSNIVSRAQTVEVLVPGIEGTYNGALYLMAAEFQLLTPIVPTRSAYFARYCKKHAEGLWSISDVSVGNSRQITLTKFRRRPSGCVIEAVDNANSRVSWVEHVEVDDRYVHQLYKPLVNSTLAFGAQHWLGTLRTQFERILITQIANMGISNQEGRRSLMRLATRLVRSYNQVVSSTTAHTWTILAGSGAEDVRVMSRKIIAKIGRPTGVVLCASSSFWIPIPLKTVLNFICNVRTRGQWDIFCNGGRTEEILHLVTGREANDCVSLLKVSGTTDATRENMLILQETRTDALGSYVIYSPLDGRVIHGVLAGDNSDNVSVLPSGISILPDGSKGFAAAGGDNINAAGGSLLTLAFQILVDSDPSGTINIGAMATINGMVTCTIDRIKACVMRSAGISNNDNTFAVVNNANVIRNNP